MTSEDQTYDYDIAVSFAGSGFPAECSLRTSRAYRRFGKLGGCSRTLAPKFDGRAPRTPEAIAIVLSTRRTTAT